MGLTEWLRRFFGLSPRPVFRDISQLASADPSFEGDTIEEVVDTSGGPLKEHHRRRALRDRRLLPKPKPKPQRFVFGKKRRRVMDKQEADRLFAATMRTRNRQLRDLLCDEEQLGRLGLPVWRTEQDVAAVLGISLGLLRHFSIHRQRERVMHYVTFSIPKRSGGRRLIMAPKRRLKTIQRLLNELLVRRLPVSEHAHGFRLGRSVRTNAEPHVGKAVVVRMDLKNFFPTVHIGRVRGLLIACGYGYPVATALAVLMTEAERQPVAADGQVYHVPVGGRHCVQGAPTSPGLCNAVLLRMDRRLAGLAVKFGFAYTRYADDLTFSGDDRAAVLKLMHLCRQIISEEGFETNHEKSRVARRGGRQIVTGVTVNETLGLSRKERRKLRAAIHRAKQAGAANGDLPARLMGSLAYLHMLNIEQAETLRGSAEPAE